MSAESTAVVRAVGNLIIPGSGLERLGSSVWRFAVYVFTPLPPLLAPLFYGYVHEDLNSYVRD